MFGIEFETAADRTASSGDGKEGTAQKEFAWQNSWGLSTRTIGVMLMVHSDDKVRASVQATPGARAARESCGTAAAIEGRALSRVGLPGQQEIM